MSVDSEIIGYEFGPFIIEVDVRRLSRNGQTVLITLKLLDILLLLLRNHGQVITKETLMSEVWPNTYVEENNLTVSISALRKALGERRKEHLYIETLPKRGYRFAAMVQEITRQSTSQENRGTEEGSADSSIAKGEAVTLAVLPLINTGTNTSLGYLTEGVTESLINRLSRLPQLRVMARSTVSRYSGKVADPREVGRVLRVKHVLTGEMLQEDEHILLRIELINAMDGTHLWGEQYQIKSANLFEVQERITHAVSNNLQLMLTVEENALLRRQNTASPEAYRFYLKGHYFLDKRTEADIRKGIEYFRKAIAEDALYAAAYTGIADGYILLAAYGAMPEKEALGMAKTCAERALELDQTLAEAHTSLGFIKTFYSWDWAGAESHFKKAIEEKPSYIPARRWYSLFLISRQRFDEALKQTEHSLLISPLSPSVNSSLGVYYYFSRHYDLSISWCKEALELDSSFYPAYACLGLSYLQECMYKQALDAHEAAFGISKDPEALSMLGYTYARAGKSAEAAQVISTLSKMSRSSYIKPYHFAIIYVGLEEKEQALVWLEKALMNRNEMLAYINVDPCFDSIRSDPHIVNILQRMAPLPS
jgi:DNA-binding winged helix-turn-helix (wHTH) protein/tetratricopeptide (TPR) repeat protein